MPGTFDSILPFKTGKLLWYILSDVLNFLSIFIHFIFSWHFPTGNSVFEDIRFN